MADGRVLDAGLLIETKEGTPQGAAISPLLANITSIDVYDRCVHQWRQRCATGDVIVGGTRTTSSLASSTGMKQAIPCRPQGEARSFWTQSSSREDAAHRFWVERNCEPPHSGLGSPRRSIS